MRNIFITNIASALVLSSPASAWMTARPNTVSVLNSGNIHAGTEVSSSSYCHYHKVSSPKKGTCLKSTAEPNTEQSHWLDYLKFDGQTPSFDIIEKTKEYTSTEGYKTFSLKDIPSDYYYEYIFRGPIIGPINRQDLVDVNEFFELQESFPDLDRQVFGFSVDPENPFRVLYFERWKATNTGKIKGILPATNKRCETPVMPFSIVWTPEGKIIYEHLTTAVDRFEGNTKGKVAVFGLLETAGVSIGSTIGDQVLIFQQKLGRKFPSKAQVYSKKEDLPSWWKSQAVGAEPNDI